MPAAELDVDGELVRALLREQHPDLADLALEEVSSGWDNVVFRLGDELSVRIPRRVMAAALVEHELRWLPELAPRLPLPIPEPVRAGRPGLGYPWSWSVVRWVPGDIAATHPPDDPADAAERLGAFLAALHQPAPVGAPVNPYRGVPLAARHARTLDALSHLDGLVDVRELRRRWDEALAVPMWTGPQIWLHGDLHPANLVVRDGRLAGVVDFGDLTAGDPATDLMAAWALLPLDQHPTFRAACGDVDDDTWRRARGWALAHGAVCLANSADNPVIAGVGRRGLAAVLADPG